MILPAVVNCRWTQIIAGAFARPKSSTFTVTLSRTLMLAGSNPGE